jgi:ABC-type cobalamin transport system permease subunit
MARRWTWFWILLLVGLSISALSIAMGSRFGFLFLLLPFIFPPLRFGGKGEATRGRKQCARCGFTTLDADVNFCPRDGSALSGR